MPTPAEITRHHAEVEVVYVGPYPTGYAMRIEEVVREIPDRMSRAAGLLG